MVKALHVGTWADDGRVVELVFSGATVTGNSIDGFINVSEAISTVVFATDDATTLALLADELILNLRVQEAVVGVNKITVTGLGANITFDSFIITGGASQATITVNELNPGKSKITPPTTQLQDVGYLSPSKPADGYENWVRKTTNLLIAAIEAGDIGSQVNLFKLANVGQNAINDTSYVDVLGLGLTTVGTSNNANDGSSGSVSTNNSSFAALTIK